MRRFRCSITAHVQENSRIIWITFFNVKEFPGSAARQLTAEKTGRNLDFTYPITYYRPYDSHRCS